MAPMLAYPPPTRGHYFTPHHLFQNPLGKTVLSLSMHHFPTSEYQATDWSILVAGTLGRDTSSRMIPYGNQLSHQKHIERPCPTFYWIPPSRSFHTLVMPRQKGEACHTFVTLGILPYLQLYLSLTTWTHNASGRFISPHPAFKRVALFAKCKSVNPIPPISFGLKKIVPCYWMTRPFPFSTPYEISSCPFQLPADTLGEQNSMHRIGSRSEQKFARNLKKRSLRQSLFNEKTLEKLIFKENGLEINPISDSGVNYV